MLRIWYQAFAIQGSACTLLMAIRVVLSLGGKGGGGGGGGGGEERGGGRRWRGGGGGQRERGKG